MNPGLTALKLEVTTENGEVYIFGIDREKTIVGVPWEDKCYPLISSGPILVGWELRGKYKKRSVSGDVHTFESTKVTNIQAQFALNRLFG